MHEQTDGRVVTNCEHGIDILHPCRECEELGERLARYYDMQTTGTFPQLTIPKQGGKMGCKGKGGKKR